MKKIQFRVQAPKRRNPVALPARKRKAGPHRDKRKEYQSRQEWKKELFEE